MNDPNPTIARLMEELWRSDPRTPAALSYAVVDGARDGRIYPRVRDHHLTHACLFSGKLAPELVQAAPYLVPLVRAASTRELLELGWGASWGILAASNVGLEELRRHFRTMLRVEDEAGKRYLFRFYDPRVLRVYLPTCTSRELRAFFGPIERFLVESDKPTRLLSYSIRGTLLHTATVDLASA